MYVCMYVYMYVCMYVCMYVRFVRARAHMRALMTQKSWAVRMRNAKLRNYLNVEETLQELLDTKMVKIIKVEKTVRMKTVKGDKDCSGCRNSEGGKVKLVETVVETEDKESEDGR